MNEIYHPKWDEVIDRSAFKPVTESNSKKVQTPNVYDPAKVNMNVNAHYKDKLIGLKIKEAITETEFVAIITSFSPPAGNYEGLSINQQVRINRDEIAGIELKEI